MCDAIKGKLRKDKSNELDRDRAIRDSFELTFALISEIARASGADFRVAFFGARPAGTGFDSEAAFSRFCDQHALDCLPLDQHLKSDSSNFVPDDGHWTENGHMRVADLFWHRWVADFSKAKSKE